MDAISGYLKQWTDERDAMFAHIAKIQGQCEVSVHHNIQIIPSLGKWAAYLLKMKWIAQREGVTCLSLKMSKWGLWVWNAQMHDLSGSTAGGQEHELLSKLHGFRVPAPQW